MIRLTAAFLLLLPALCAAQNQLPTTTATATAGAQTTAAAESTSTSSAPPAATTTSIPPPFPPSASISASYTPLPAPSAQPIRDVVYSVTPAEPLPVSDPLNGPWLLPDFAEAWDEAYERARALIANWTLEQKVQATTGVGWQNDRCVGNIPPIGNWTGLCLQDSPLGVRFGDFVTAFPAAINAAATWDRKLIRARSYALGREFRGKGAHVALSPMMNLGRLATGGRNWEGFGADPYLSGEAAFESVLGLQEAGVQATAKHFILNEQEHARTHSTSQASARTLRELYAHPFLKSVMAGVASVMCSYNLIDGVYACENDALLNGLLKHEHGFRGYVQSDWQATHSTLSALYGLDMTMPGDIVFNSGDSYFGGNLTAYVQNGTIPTGRVDDMAARILAGYFLLKQDEDFPPVNFDSWDLVNSQNNSHVDVQEDHADLVREIGAKSTVLLKNTNGSLPLKAPRSVILIGSDAGPPKRGPNGYADRGGVDGLLAMGWGSGTTNFPYLITPLEAVQARARKNRTSVDWWLDDFDAAGAATAAQTAEVALVFINSDSGEEYITVDGNEGDRKNLTAWHAGDELVKTIADAHPNVMVVVHSVGPAIVEPWIEHPNVTAVLWAGLPGQEAGHSLVDVLYGAQNPSAKLPYTIARSTDDYPADVVRGGNGQEVLIVPYDEGLLIDHRWFDAKNITPRFEFGFGLSYTTFGYEKLRVWNLKEVEGSEYSEEEENWDKGGVTPDEVGASAAAWLHAPAYSVQFDLENIGAVSGTEVAQVYVRFPPTEGEPPQVLRGFASVDLKPGEKKTVVVTLSRYALSVWDEERRGWRKPEGEFGVVVGASSRDRRLSSKLAV